MFHANYLKSNKTMTYVVALFKESNHDLFRCIQSLIVIDEVHQISAMEILLYEVSEL